MCRLLLLCLLVTAMAAGSDSMPTAQTKSPYPYRKFALDKPDLNELAGVLASEMRAQYERVSVSVEPCPDLRKPPFNLTAPGLVGRTAIADVGGIFYLIPIPNVKKIFSFEKIADIMDLSPESFMIGASAGPLQKLGHNSEMMPDALLSKQQNHFKVVADQSFYARVEGSGYRLGKTTAGEFVMLGNFFVSEGKPGPVLKIVAEKRTGADDFVTTVREILRSAYNRTISLGGVFLIESGKAKMHIMPELPDKPITSMEAFDRWAKFFDMDAPLVCLTTMHSRDPGLSLRMDHSHCFSDHNQGGHYHNDTTPAVVRYVAYLNAAEAIFRVDDPFA